MPLLTRVCSYLEFAAPKSKDRHIGEEDKKAYSHRTRRGLVPPPWVLQSRCNHNSVSSSTSGCRPSSRQEMINPQNEQPPFAAARIGCNGYVKHRKGVREKAA